MRKTQKNKNKNQNFKERSEKERKKFAVKKNMTNFALAKRQTARSYSSVGQST